MPKYSDLRIHPNAAARMLDTYDFVEWRGSEYKRTAAEAIGLLRKLQRDRLAEAYGKRTHPDATQDIRRASRIIRAAFDAGVIQVAVDVAKLPRSGAKGCPTIYLLLFRQFGATCKIRLSSHFQKSRFIGGWCAELDKNFTPSQLSIVNSWRNEADAVVRFVLPYIRDWCRRKKPDWWYCEDVEHIDGSVSRVWVPTVQIDGVSSPKWHRVHKFQLAGHHPAEG